MNNNINFDALISTLHEIKKRDAIEADFIARELNQVIRAFIETESEHPLWVDNPVQALAILTEKVGVASMSALNHHLKGAALKELFVADVARVAATAIRVLTYSDYYDLASDEDCYYD